MAAPSDLGWLRTFSLALFLSLALCGIARTAPNCPAPSVLKSGQCVLSGDAVLDKMMRVPSETELNCRGYRLTPAVPGVLDDPRTAANEFQPAEPPLAILLHRSTGTKIQNCVIAGFDFGILVLGTKTPPGLSERAIAHRRNKILANTIDVRTNAISLTRADNTLVFDNDLTYASERGRGIVLELDSDDNQIVGNTVTSTDAASTGQVQLVPGGPFVDGTATMDNEIHCLLQNRQLRNMVLEGELIQITLADDTRDPHPDEATIEDSLRTDHNLIESNTIVDLGYGPSCTLDPGIACRTNQDCPAGRGPCLLKQNSGIGFNIRAGDTAVRGNSLSGRMERGVSFGGNPTPVNIPNFYAGTCTGDPTRLCIDDTDCSIPGLPAVGTCSGVDPITFNGNSVGLVAEDNILTGIYDAAALFANNTADFAYRGNVVQVGTATPTGVHITPRGINGTVERNGVNGALSGLFVERPAATTWSIRLNDFTGYVDAIRTSNDFNLATTLGGNYWGAPCPGLDPSRVRFTNGSVNPNVTDVSYGVPVAATPEQLLPAPCAGGEVASLQAEVESSAIPAWVLEPAEFPQGQQGRNDCTFPLGAGAQWDFHPGGGCWERPGPEGWTRQQFHQIHDSELASCGGPGDLSGIRVCRPGGADQPSPCEGKTTGPVGCAVCVSAVNCH